MDQFLVHLDKLLKRYKGKSKRKKRRRAAVGRPAALAGRSPALGRARLVGPHARSPAGGRLGSRSGPLGWAASGRRAARARPVRWRASRPPRAPGPGRPCSIIGGGARDPWRGWHFDFDEIDQALCDGFCLCFKSSTL
jgi:hypothetical protein